MGADYITVTNPRQAAPSSFALTASTGNSADGVDAQVHVSIVPGNAKVDSDFRSFAVWASTSPGFTPGPSNFKGLASLGDNRLSFPAASATTVYVRVGGLDFFHAEPELISTPTTEVNLAPELSVAPIDGAVFPVQSDDIANGAVTGLAAENGTHTGAFTGLQTLTTLSVAAGGRLGIDLGVTLTEKEVMDTVDKQLGAIARPKAALGGIEAISASHPHFYSSMVEWSHTFDHAPIFIPRADRT